MPKFNASTPKCRKRLQRAGYVVETIERDIRQALRQVGFTAEVRREVGYPLDFITTRESNEAIAPSVDRADRDWRGSLPMYSTLTDHDAFETFTAGGCPNGTSAPATAPDHGDGRIVARCVPEDRAYGMPHPMSLINAVVVSEACAWERGAAKAMSARPAIKFLSPAPEASSWRSR